MTASYAIQIFTPCNLGTKQNNIFIDVFFAGNSVHKYYESRLMNFYTHKPMEPTKDKDKNTFYTTERCFMPCLVSPYS